MGVLAIWRYPVKAMLGERVSWADAGPGGLEGDRRWAVRDAATGERIASKRGPTDPRLRACRARLEDGELVVTAPGGAAARGAREARRLRQRDGRGTPRRRRERLALSGSAA